LDGDDRIGADLHAHLSVLAASVAALSATVMEFRKALDQRLDRQFNDLEKKVDDLRAATRDLDKGAAALREHQLWTQKTLEMGEARLKALEGERDSNRLARERAERDRKLANNSYIALTVTLVWNTVLSILFFRHGAG
jgi:chromosome segregation ATPase